MAEENKTSLEQKKIEAKKEKITKPKLSSVYDLLEGAIKIWWKNLVKFIKVYLWGLLYSLMPAVLGIIIVVIMAKSNVNNNLLIAIPLILFFFCCVFATIYFIIRSYISFFLLVKKNYEGNELEIFKETKKYFWPYFWLSVLTSVLILLWALLLIIPGIIYSVFYSFAVYVFFFEGLRGMKAIKRSISLVKNYWWEVLGRFAVIGIVLYVVMMIVSIPLYMTDQNSLFYEIWTGVTQVFSFIIAPVSMLYFYQIYKDLVVIKK